MHAFGSHLALVRADARHGAQVRTRLALAGVHTLYSLYIASTCTKHGYERPAEALQLYSALQRSTALQLYILYSIQPSTTSLRHLSDGAAGCMLSTLKALTWCMCALNRALPSQGIMLDNQHRRSSAPAAGVDCMFRFEHARVRPAYPRDPCYLLSTPRARLTIPITSSCIRR